MSFDWIADSGAGAVSFHVADLRWLDASIHAGIAHEARLGFGTWQRDAICVAILSSRLSR